MTPDLLARLNEARAAKRPVALLTRLPDGAQTLFPGDSLPDALAAEAAAALRADKARNLVLDGETWFIHPHNPPLRLIVVGAVHIAQALVPMAATLGYAVTVVDPRRAFATEERLGAEVAISGDWPDEAMTALAPDTRTAVVTLTHDPKLDDPALEVALRSPAFYIGCLGSRKTHAKRLERLREAGLTEAELEKIHAPVGLDIGAITAAEIAVSILAQIVATRRRAAPETARGPKPDKT
ncbi:XdhC family protein [Falsiroseomonas sp.]|uniref:XdhC family protein n=1 Tax=Falsiroseomonas sp. TaxID=2870721 RepID=UPI00271B3503|nr:XdhC family protein [Falsiroseomonas sp.]MDO9498788.1 XdhC family protein [Falsiroseomonas sp.]MDP3419212.1 XdhC family protein [Falsiroseomonas sp.]